MSFHLGTKERLLLITDEMEMVVKEMLENFSFMSTKHAKNSPADQIALGDLLVSKHKELRDMLCMAEEQAKIEEKMDELRAKVEVQDVEIQKLQRTFKEAEQLLSTALFQARNKLTSIQQANKSPVSAEELIKYAHRISASNAVSAPLTWCNGDLRRPYPTDIEMRNGFLGKSELNINGGVAPHQNNTPDLPRTGNMSEVPNTYQNQFNWNTMGELHMHMGSAASSVPLETRTHKENAPDDVEVMSTDSSSSSSSDSQ